MAASLKGAYCAMADGNRRSTVSPEQNTATRTDDAACVPATSIAINLRGIIVAAANVVRTLPRIDELTHYGRKLGCGHYLRCG